ncbi:Transcriptional activator protein CopR [Vibrio crassostreae]|nr:Transcriptional activator protein CopR [Vibrio crassostreae]
MKLSLVEDEQKALIESGYVAHNGIGGLMSLTAKEYALLEL